MKFYLYFALFSFEKSLRLKHWFTALCMTGRIQNHSALAIITAMILCAVNLKAQSVFDRDIKFYGGALQEARRIIRTPDDKFLVVGYLAPSDVSLNRDAFVLKMDANGVILWANKYGGVRSDEFYDVVQVGSYYYCVGYTRSFVNGFFPTLSGNLNADIFLVKIQLDGTLVWAKNMGKPANGTSATDGNDIGLRLIAAGQGGVVIVARINSGATTNQNNGLISVDGAGKVRWAYQYDLTSHSSNNELTFSIWKDGPDSYITGGWIGTFGSPSYTGGILFKVDKNGSLVWDKNTRCSPGIFESLYYGYYNHKTGKIYSTDYYSESNGSIREIQVCTNKASDGTVPTPGAIPQAKRFHYGTAGSSQNNYRSLIFPVGDGYEQFVLASNHLKTPVINETQHATLISSDEEFNFQWAKQVGVHHEPSLSNGVVNSIYDVVTCDGANQSLLSVGTIYRKHSGGTLEKDVLLARFGGSGTLESCEAASAVNNANLTETATSMNLTKINLNAANCGSNCWADNDLINNNDVSVTSLNLTTDITEVATGACTGDRMSTEPLQKGGGGPNNIIVTEILDISGQSQISFQFSKQPSESYFEITSPGGDFVYARFFNNAFSPNSSIDISSFSLPPGEYVWTIEAVYQDEPGIEIKSSSFLKL